MDRHFQCACGGTAWVSHEDGLTTIECASCSTCVQAETLTLAKQAWKLQQTGPTKPNSKTRGR